MFEPERNLKHDQQTTYSLNQTIETIAQQEDISASPNIVPIQVYYEVPGVGDNHK